MPSKVLSTLCFGVRTRKRLIAVTVSGCVQVKLSRKLLFFFPIPPACTGVRRCRIGRESIFRDSLPPEFCISATARGTLVSHWSQQEL